MDLLALRVIVFAVLAFAYMMFDVLNNRNVPSYFAYASLVVGAAFTVLYLNVALIFYSALIAVATVGFGYVVYRIGQLGAADVIELAALSLIVPFLSKPLVFGVAQQYMPLVLSVAINSGIAALIVVPLYYIPKALATKQHGYKRNTPATYFRIALIVTVYAFFGLFLILVLHASYAAMGILLVIAAGSALVMGYESRMMAYMSQYVTYRKMEAGDIIATGMMEPKEVDYAGKKLKHFERLVTPELIAELRSKMPKRRFPVYKKPIPFAVPIFIGAITALAFGNVLLFLLPAYP
ncbi:hypothetical protein M1567_01595 [Candidatus Marsarchaeota archaeon]|jgi:hypothetical protein|nr:hypothetical protein [Candidatus Marsarchaeota archaeon]